MMLRRANPGMMMLAPLATHNDVVVDIVYPVLQTEHTVPAALQESQFDGHATQAFVVVVVKSPVHSMQCPELSA
jgi:hypothetical protein